MIAWLAVIILAGIVEAVVPTLISIWFIPGGLAGLIVSLLGGDLWLQILLFLVISGLSLLCTRPLVKKMQRSKKTPTNVDALIGRIGVVTEEIQNLFGKGRVEVGGNSWSARGEEQDSVLPVGAQVEVLRIEGVKLIVRRKNPS